MYGLALSYLWFRACQALLNLTLSPSGPKLRVRLSLFYLVDPTRALLKALEQIGPGFRRAYVVWVQPWLTA